MADTYLSIPELSETLSVDDNNYIVVRKGLTDNKITVLSFKQSILEDASTTKKGVVQLSSSYVSNSISAAATPSAVKAAYDRASTALVAANNAQSTVAEKAPLNHTHDASDIVSGRLSQFRVVWATPSSFGLMRPTSNLANSSANGWSPSIEKVRTLEQNVSGLQQQIDSLELGSAFTPLPTQSLDNGERNFPIGTTLLVNTGPFCVPRNSTMDVYFSFSRDSSYRDPQTMGANAIGLYTNSGEPSRRLSGTWANRGSASPVPYVSDRKLVTKNSSGVIEDKYLNCTALMQRIS